MIDAVNGLLLAIPDFVWALALVLAIRRRVAASAADRQGRSERQRRHDDALLSHREPLRLRFDVFFDLLKHLAMPTLALGLPLAAVIARVLKGALNEAMAQDYVLLARLKGMSELPARPAGGVAQRDRSDARADRRSVHLPIGGTVIIERIFAYPGIGNMAIEAVINRDLPLIQDSCWRSPSFSS